jgi:peptide/nickel transport system permease protein
LWIGSLVIVATVTVAILAPQLAPDDPYRSSIDVLASSSRSHLLGTDDLGRDIASRVIYGARTSLTIGCGAALVAVAIGVPLGLVAGYIRGRLDAIMVAVFDLFLALPGLVLALIITVMVGPSVRNLVLVLGFVTWPSIARLVRGQALAVRESVFVEAARAVGGSQTRILWRHVWPSVLPVVASQFAVCVSFAIFTSASLSFLGLGIPAPTADWGSMVRSGYEYLAINPLLSLAPGAAVTFTVMGFYVLGASFK